MHQGVWQKPGGALAVALKMVKPGSSEQERVKFLQEAAIIGQFHHKNILTSGYYWRTSESIFSTASLSLSGDTIRC